MTDPTPALAPLSGRMPASRGALAAASSACPQATPASNPARCLRRSPARTLRWLPLVAVLAGGLVGGAARAQSAPAAAPAGPGAHAHHRLPPAAAVPRVAAERVGVSLRDTPLSDQDGRRLRLGSEAIGDRIAVVGFIYTSCQTVCPVVSGIMAMLQDKLGERLDQDVRLISLSVDPLRDTPARLRKYAARHQAKPGWLWLTGSPQRVGEALTDFGTYTPNFEDHPAVVMVGDRRSGEWTRFYGFASPEQLLARIDQIAAARRAGGENGGAPAAVGAEAAR